MAPRLVVADTDLLIDYLRGADPGATWVRDSLRDGGLRIAAISAFELRLGADFVARRGPIELLLVHQTLPLDLSAAILAGDVLTRLRRAGAPIGIRDALVAGTCLRFELPLATRNLREFSRVEDLVLVDVEEQPLR